MAAAPGHDEPHEYEERDPKVYPLRNLSTLDPTKKGTLEPWMETVSANAPDDIKTAMAMRACPTLDAIRNSWPTLSQDDAAELYMQMYASFEHAQKELYKVVTTKVKFDSAMGAALFDTFTTQFKEQGVDALLHLQRRLSTNNTYAKQVALREQITPAKMKEAILGLGSPDDACDYLTTLFVNVWAKIEGNHKEEPIDFIRLVLNAMKAGGDDLKMIAHAHTTSLSAAFTGEYDGHGNGIVDTSSKALPLVYTKYGLFIETVTRD